ncbi:MAG: tetratricopeptide repeat protein [Verrucomicrobia bacterium]|nr:tetratricopeptide repeat protein [Verrucomicrobiota bacterium]
MKRKMCLSVVRVAIISVAAVWGSAVWAGDPNPTMLDQAFTLYRQGNYEGAQQQLIAAYGQKEMDATGYQLQGNIQARQHKWDKALASYEKVLETNPEDPEIRLNMAELHFMQRDFQNAAPLYKEYLNKNPGNPIAAFKVLLCLLLDGKEDEADAWIETTGYRPHQIGYYYFQAAKAFAAGDATAGEYFVVSARQLFAENEIRLLNSLLVEQGWLTESEAGTQGQ